jgi:hypothetical protein
VSILYYALALERDTFWARQLTHYVVKGSESDLVLGLISKSRLNAEDRKSHSYLAYFFENQLLLDLVEDDCTSTFTHSDLQMKNIQVREISSQELSQGKDYDVSIVDGNQRGGILATGNSRSLFCVYVG